MTSNDCALPLALWNERDAILKERLFGLTNSEANHGEDVKEYYFYLDSTPTHSYMKYLYKYPQREYPYRDLIETNRRRSREEFEYELLDTGIFNDDRYFDVFVEYAKEGPEDVLIRITVHNRGPEAARLRVLPTLWFRNTWSWGDDDRKPSLREAGPGVIQAVTPRARRLLALLRRRPGVALHGKRKQCATSVGSAQSVSLCQRRVPRLRHLWTSRSGESRQDGDQGRSPLCPRCARRWQQDGPAAFSVRRDKRCLWRLRQDVQKPDRRRRRILRTDCAQLAERRSSAGCTARHWPECSGASSSTTSTWSSGCASTRVIRCLSLPVTMCATPSGSTCSTADVISMPDKWEYPWYAAWDLAFHTIALSLVDFDFAKEQLLLMLRSLYFHPSGQIPAYEWNFSDVNPPVHAWATLWLYKYERQLGRADLRFLERSFQGLMLNFNWWVNRKDPSGRNVFAGGFLGLDNIGVFDRSAQLPTGGSLEQADGTAWMAFYCQNMLEMALILCEYDPMYEEIAFKFVQHFMWIAYAMDRLGEHHDEMWDEQDGFFL